MFRSAEKMVTACALLPGTIISLGFDTQKTFSNVSLNGTIGNGLDNFLLVDRDISPVHR